MWQIVVGAVVAGILTLSSAPAPAPSASGGPSASAPSSAPAAGAKRFWVKDKHRYASPWYAGKRRKMIGYGCTRAPYYDPDPRCTKQRGFHHGLDIAMPCGTKLFAGFRGWVVRPASQGSLGSAYGRKAFRLRNHRKDVDVVVGHVRRVYVDPGDRVRKGQLIARSGKLGAPDGCHLHYEVRPIRGGYQSAVRPHRYLMLRR